VSAVQDQVGQKKLDTADNPNCQLMDGIKTSFDPSDTQTLLAIVASMKTINDSIADAQPLDKMPDTSSCREPTTCCMQTDTVPPGKNCLCVVNTSNGDEQVTSDSTFTMI